MRGLSGRNGGIDGGRIFRISFPRRASDHLPGEPAKMKIFIIAALVFLLASALFYLLAFLAKDGTTVAWRDNSTNEDGFYIEKKPVGASTFMRIAQVGPNVTTYFDASGVPGDCYRVQAYNAAGMSGYTNEACKLGHQASPVAPNPGRAAN